MPSSFEQTWNSAKTAFENATGKKKPSAGFLGVFNRSGLQGVCRDLDGAFGRDADAMQKAFDRFRKEAADYQKTLAAAEKKEAGDYQRELQKLSGVLDAMAREYQRALEVRLPRQITLPDAISRSDNIFARVRTKAFLLKPVRVSVGFSERSVRISRMVAAEFDGLVQTLIQRSSNIMRDLEIEVAKLVAAAEAKAASTRNEAAIEKITAALRKDVAAVVEHHKALADATVDKLCADWFRKYDLAAQYKRGFVKTMVVGTIGITASVTMLAVTGGGAAPAIALAIVSNVKILLTACSAAHNYGRAISKTEKELVSQTAAVIERFARAGPEWKGKVKIESRELLATIGLPVSAVGAMENTLAEYARKCVDYEAKHLRPLQTAFRTIMRDVHALVGEDPKLGRRIAKAFERAFDALAKENVAMQARADLRIRTRENLDVLNGRRADAVKRLNQTVEAGLGLAGIAAILKNVAEIAMKVAA
ncbi:hypothetical protein [Arenibaculum pallidiluteum]|uniref:hypothetical protein n=1 Tax=Arenibaculum pallidiluteum TaxID=2812559 RepID=UPI001A95FFE9|nr:hypothetical protein [Arenibaculum pallidiluteum]